MYQYPLSPGSPTMLWMLPKSRNGIQLPFTKLSLLCGPSPKKWHVGFHPPFLHRNHPGAQRYRPGFWTDSIMTAPAFRGAAWKRMAGLSGPLSGASSFTAQNPVLGFTRHECSSLAMGARRNVLPGSGSGSCRSRNNEFLPLFASAWLSPAKPGCPLFSGNSEVAFKTNWFPQLPEYSVYKR